MSAVYHTISVCRGAVILLLAAVLILLAGCGEAPAATSPAETAESAAEEKTTAEAAETTAAEENAAPEETKTMTYTQISQEEAREMMERDDGHIIIDVRRPDEYESGHIPGAVCIPNESIETEPPAELPDKEQIILVYCRSGRRSKDASQKLANMGYANVYEFGGIIDWTGETVTGAETEDAESLADAVQPVAQLIIEANGHTFYADFEDNPSAEALCEKLSSEPLELSLHDYGGFEKVGDLPWELPRSDESITTESGDIILYQGDQITIYYDQNTWDFTRLAKIGGVSTEDLLEVLGSGDVTVTFRVEWSE